jgi:hypothetical protein
VETLERFVKVIEHIYSPATGRILRFFLKAVVFLLEAVLFVLLIVSFVCIILLMTMLGVKS